MHRLFILLESQVFADQDDANAILNALLTGDEIITTYTCGTVTTIRHLTIQAHTASGITTIGIAIQPLGIQRSRDGFNATNGSF